MTCHQVNVVNGLLNGVVFIDLTKLLDTIDHEIILRKMPFLTRQVPVVPKRPNPKM